MKRLLSLALILPLAACSTGTPPATSPSAQSSSVASAAASVAPDAATPTVAEGWTNAVKFAELALGKKFEAARAFASPGSAADRYLTHQVAFAEAFAAGGGSGNDPQTPTANRDAGTISFSQGNGRDEAVWKAFTYDEAGKVTGWALEDTGTLLANQLWTKAAEATLKGATVKLVSAYQNSFGLWVVLDITSADRDLKMDFMPSLTDAKKRQRSAASVHGPEDIMKGTSAYVVYAFEGATFGGSLTYTLRSSSYSEVGKVTLSIA